MITLTERQRYRRALQHLDSLLDPLNAFREKQKPIPSHIALILLEMTKTADIENQYQAVKALREAIDKQFDDELRYAAQFHFSPFCEYMRRNEPPAMHHEFLIEHLEQVHNKEIMRLAISLPPGSAKTTYASIRFAAWHLGRRPNDRWLQGAHTQTFAKDRLGKPVRGVITEPRYQEVFPEMMLSASSSAADYFEFAHREGYYKAVGVGVGISGFRAEIAAIDDPIASREDAESPTIRRKLHEWYDDDFGTRPMPGSPIFVVATRWHEDDLIGHELQKMAEGRGDHWEVINIPAIAGPADPLGRKEGDALWPEVFGKDFYLAKKRSLTGRSWNSLYQGTPTDEEGGVLKRENVSRYKNLPKDELRQGVITKRVVKKITLSVDCAEKATQRSDYTAATVWMETMDKHHYLIHAARGRFEFVEMVHWIEELAKNWDAELVLVEDRGAGTQYIQLRNSVPGKVPVIPIATQQKSKEFRFDGVTPMFATGEVLIPDVGTEWIADVEAELFAFPAGKHDDYVDSISQYLARARESSGHRRGVRKMRSSTHAS
jgi:predicted phage terminase large subunit-like protein